VQSSIAAGIITAHFLRSFAANARMSINLGCSDSGSQDAGCEDTLVVCSGEFGRTVYAQGKLNATDYGRDHHPRCFTAWLAAEESRRHQHGRTDEYSYYFIDQNGQRTTRFEDDAVHINDLNATILNQLGIDHRRLTFRFQGLDQRLTGVEEAHVVEKIIT
jgi:hypothetical protein